MYFDNLVKRIIENKQPDERIAILIMPEHTSLLQLCRDQDLWEKGIYFVVAEDKDVMRLGGVDLTAVYGINMPPTNKDFNYLICRLRGEHKSVHVYM